jgi:hypothetical protein
MSFDFTTFSANRETARREFPAHSGQPTIAIKRFRNELMEQAILIYHKYLAQRSSASLLSDGLCKIHKPRNH